MELLVNPYALYLVPWKLQSDPQKQTKLDAAVSEHIIINMQNSKKCVGLNRCVHILHL